MHRIEALISGIRGAEAGTVSLYQRGTTTPVTCYTDFEGTATFSGSSVSLDANGRAVVFVNELVDVVARSSLGATVVEWTAGDSAPCVELRSLSATGTAYSGGAVAPGNPTTVKAWADSWVASAGAPDFKVDINGVDTDLDSAFAAVAGLRYFVVTDPTYGAVGDGVTNNLGPFQAALNAASAAGGGVVFVPRGTFRINGQLTSYATVSLVGADRYSSFIIVDNAALPLFSGAPLASVSTLNITTSAVNYAGTLFQVAADGATRVSNAQIAGSVSGSLFGVSGGFFFTWEADGCSFGTRATGYVLNQGAGVCGVTVRGCTVSASSSENAANSVFLANVISIHTTTVNVLNSGFAGTKTVCNGPASITASSLQVSQIGSAVVTVYSTAALREFGTYVGSAGIIMYAATVGLASSQLGSRLLRTTTVSADVDPVTIPALNYRHVQARCTTAAGWAGNCQVAIDQAPRAADLVLSFWNDTAAPITFEWSTNVSVAGGTTFAVAANSFRTFLLVSGDNDPTSTTKEWFLVAATGGAEVAE